ncbi:hypothetical protein C6501_17250 [Candidatus Poribacteria bacterium]|nr:MAG: hypothetical protein C6501_17250 [Candidatus Poribacteria bacterium]
MVIRMKEGIQNIIDLFINPSATFRRLKSKPRWMLAFSVYLILSVLLAWALTPFTLSLLADRSVQSQGHNKAHIVFSSALVSMTYTMLWFLLLCCLLTIAVRMLKVNKDIKSKHIFAAVMHTIIVRITTFFVNVGLLPLFKNPEDIQTPMDTRIVPGLHLLTGSLQDQNLLMFLSYINPLEFWYIFVLTIGIYILVEISRIKAFVTALIVWLLRVSLDVLYIALFLQ